MWKPSVKNAQILLRNLDVETLKGQNWSKPTMKFAQICMLLKLGFQPKIQ